MASTPTRNREYYWDTVIFLVEDSLFKVPRYYFVEKSDIFHTTFSLPGTGTAEGGSDRAPFKLEGVNKDDFWNLLRVIYPKYYTQGIDLSPTQWLGVLRLSSMWNFSDVQKSAVEKLSTATDIDPVERVTLARTHKIPSWLIKGYTELVTRQQPISVSEGHILGMEATVSLFHVREKLNRPEESQSRPGFGSNAFGRVSAYGSSSPFGSSTTFGLSTTVGSSTKEAAIQIIKVTFQAELTEIEATATDFALQLGASTDNQPQPSAFAVPAR